MTQLVVSAQMRRYRELRWRDVDLASEEREELERIATAIQSERDDFTLAEAQGLLGVSVVAGVAFSGVPKGTRGEIVAYYGGKHDRYHVDVAWDGIRGGSPHELSHGGRRIDGFGRREVLMFLSVEWREVIA